MVLAVPMARGRLDIRANFAEKVSSDTLFSMAPDLNFFNVYPSGETRGFLPQVDTIDYSY